MTVAVTVVVAPYRRRKSLGLPPGRLSTDTQLHMVGKPKATPTTQSGSQDAGEDALDAGGCYWKIIQVRFIGKLHLLSQLLLEADQGELGTAITWRNSLAVQRMIQCSLPLRWDRTTVSGSILNILASFYRSESTTRLPGSLIELRVLLGPCLGGRLWWTPQELSRSIFSQWRHLACRRLVGSLQVIWICKVRLIDIAYTLLDNEAQPHKSSVHGLDPRVRN